MGRSVTQRRRPSQRTQFLANNTSFYERECTSAYSSFAQPNHSKQRDESYAENCFGVCRWCSPDLPGLLSLAGPLSVRGIYASVIGANAAVKRLVNRAKQEFSSQQTRLLFMNQSQPPLAPEALNLPIPNPGMGHKQKIILAFSLGVTLLFPPNLC
jgi:hypothetical protein